MTKRVGIEIILLIGSPLVIAELLLLFFQFPFLVSSAVGYFILVLFHLPANSPLSASADFETKKVNPHFKALPTASSMKRLDMLKFVLLILLLIGCLYLYVEKIR
ncbi:hypothetical protein MX629_00330 [Carnobacterium divergens]|uniref:DUF3899 domain-containing protein n=1 Tax=Carnobacterium divergens TaxID=2748 RepID=A0AAW8R7J4_CARDV|nr:hypothetical protein [Carnobacterium divergens]MDT1956865.1 hypothetical protein [Carnobacterium divergens]MDT1972835.1 hypothetical protein [Carnobacterium divergens]